MEDDWNVVSVECGSLAAKWEQLSACLGLAKADIDRIRESRPRDIAGCWSEALSQWIKQNYSTQRFGLPSWRSLLKAVAMVDKRLCKYLAAKHLLGMHHKTFGLQIQYSKHTVHWLLTGADPGGGGVDRVASHPPSPILLCSVV